MPAVTGPLAQAALLPAGPYSRLNTYIAIIASDGDNMQVGRDCLIPSPRIIMPCNSPAQRIACHVRTALALSKSLDRGSRMVGSALHVNWPMQHQP